MTHKPPSEREIFEQAFDLPAGERAAYIDRACAEDAALRDRVLRLLQAADSGFLESPTISQAAIAAEVPGERLGETIDRYKLLEIIGEGGFGAVYMAEQREPVQRRVALKVIKLGMDTRQVIARFEAERQALAMMSHPGIARVLDAGATERGRPYFVMELVRGVPITRHCDEHNLSLRDRLELFIKVCQAVQHAHQKGVIHRDLKPGNILVTMHDGEALPKIIDFGIAKATSSRLTERTLFTEFRQFVGTPAYMSPEQAGMSDLDIDTRSDIYSLGVLLYELLVGAPPFDPAALRAKDYAELQRAIREDEPPRPSTRFSTLGGERQALARLRSAEADRIARLLKGELDWIVMKAMAKKRSQRYDSATALADDVRRYLRDEPVVAGPPTARYRLAKALHRHRAPIAVGAVVSLVIIGALAGTTWGLVAAQRERDRALAAEAQERAQRLRAEEQQRITDELMMTSTEWLTDAAEYMRNLAAGADAQPPKRVEQFASEYDLTSDEVNRIGELAQAVESAFNTVGQALGQSQAARARAEGRLSALAEALEHWAVASVASDPGAHIAAADQLIATAEATLGPGDPRTAELTVALALHLDAPSPGPHDAWRIDRLRQGLEHLDETSPLRDAARRALESLRTQGADSGN